MGRRRVSALVTLLVAAGCKERQPPIDAAALCAEHRPRLEARWAWFVSTAKLLRGADPLEHDTLPQRPLKLRELHPLDPDGATADANTVGDGKRGVTGSCLLKVEKCDAADPTLELALKACASIDSWVLLKTTHQEDPRPIEGHRKYAPGKLRGEAHVYSLEGDPTRLGAFSFGTKLTGAIEVERDWAPAQVDAALQEAMRTTAWNVIEQRLMAAPSSAGAATATGSGSGEPSPR